MTVSMHRHGMNLSTHPLWHALRVHAVRCQAHFNLRQALQVPGRFDSLSLQAPHVALDCSKNLWDEAVLEALVQLAEVAGLPQRRDALLAGQVVNLTEQRPALHAALRAGYAPRDAHGVAHPVARCPELDAGVQAMLALAEKLRTQGRFSDVVHLGIGGSGLGPELALQALQPWCKGGPRVRVVSNMDGHDVHQALQGLTPANTLVTVASKSWTTAETQRNVATAQAWLQSDPTVLWDQHCVAITARPAAALQSGVTQVLPMPEGVGGRFSVWSAVGLPLALAVGRQVFERFLAGAAAMDAHFAQAPLERNAPVWLGLLDVWHSSFLQWPGRCVAPYHHGLRRLPAYLQQLEMESNGKQVQEDGTPVCYPTAGLVWGEPGSNAQHAFFQWLHQGTQRVPVEFIAARTAAHGLPGHQEALLANALAQAQALMQGAQVQPGQLPGHQHFPGNRPSTFMLLDALTPESFGALLALHEHRVFVAGTVWGINSFDQWGVELGKTLASDLLGRMANGDVTGLDASTAGLLEWCRRGEDLVS